MLIHPDTDLAPLVGVPVTVVRPESDGTPVGTFTGVFTALHHCRDLGDQPWATAYAGGTLRVDATADRAACVTSFAVPYGTDITTQP